MSDDPTKVIGEAPPQTPPTQPTIETVLERINALGERLEAKITAEIQALRIEMNERFNEVEKRFTQVDEELSTLNEKIGILNDDFLEVKAQQRMHGKRIGDLERKAS
jgi:hypothetical protein